MSQAVQCAAAVLLGALLSPPAARAGAPVGRAVAVRGTVEVARGGEEGWRVLPVAAPVFAGDHVRTSGDGVVKILFDDESVVDLGGAGALLEIQRYDVDPAATQPRSLLRLQSGAMVARVSDFYAPERWRYEIETPTAVARAQPGKIMVTYAPSGTSTDVIAFEHGAQVRGVLGVIGPAVDLQPGQFTRVQQGQFPTPPQDLDRAALAAHEKALFLVGTGEREGLDARHPLVAGELVRDEDRLAGATAAGAGPSYIDTGAPGETLQDRLSPDLRVHTQPIPEFEKVPPGVPPAGNVEVDF
jgi:FecR protein